MKIPNICHSQSAGMAGYNSSCQPKKRICKNCGARIINPPGKLQKRRKFCTDDCYYEALKKYQKFYRKTYVGRTEWEKSWKKKASLYFVHVPSSKIGG